MGSQGVGHDWATELNWTEHLNHQITLCYQFSHLSVICDFTGYKIVLRNFSKMSKFYVFFAPGVLDSAPLTWPNFLFCWQSYWNRQHHNQPTILLFKKCNKAARIIFPKFTVSTILASFYQTKIVESLNEDKLFQIVRKLIYTCRV